MKTAWMYKDPECGVHEDEFGGTHVYEDCGQTLAEQYPDMHFQCPWWAAVILRLTARMHSWAQCFVTRWDVPK